MTRCRAGWLAVRTTMLCSQFNSPTLSPSIPPTTIHRPIALFAGWLHYLRVSRTIIGSVALQSGQSHYNWVSHATIRLGMLQSGWACCYRVGHTIIRPSWCAFPPCFCSAPLHTPPHHSLQRISLYLHTPLFSFCCCNPGRLSLALALPCPCHLSLRYF